MSVQSMKSEQADRVELERFRAGVVAALSSLQAPAFDGYWVDHVPTLQRWQQTLFEAGLVGVAYPEQFGGRGLTSLHQAVVYEEIARHNLPTPIGGPGLDVAGLVVVRHASPDMAERLIPALLSGRELWSLGFSEPGSGSDLASVSTTAHRDGDDFVINGGKIWTGFAAYSSRLLLLARTNVDVPAHRGLSLFVVDMKTDGLTKSMVHEMTGEPDAERTQFYRLTFSDMRVPASAVVGELDRGWEYLLGALSGERGLYILRRHAELRAQFTTLLQACDVNDLSAGQLEDVARIDVLLQVLHAQSESTVARALEHPGESLPEDSADKLFFAFVDQELNHLAIDLLGGYRGTKEMAPSGADAHKLSINYLYSRAASIYSGTDQVQKNIIATRKLGFPRV
jgi:alkylation response protein AidB-like acyl-CoA dehydrogenase